MKKTLLQQLMLYRYRYAVAYTLFFALLVALLTVELTGIPSGLSAAERQTAVQSVDIKLSPDTRIIDLPYHLFQKASIKVLGLTEYAIKLPSILFGLLSGIGIILLLRRWFSHNVALIAALFIITNVLFLAAARTGTPTIMLIFFSTWVLLLATLIIQGARWQFLWRISFGGIIAASLYTPLSLYVLVSCLVAGILHPHARYVVKRYGSRQLAGALFLFVPIIVPLLIGMWKKPDVILQLLSIPKQVPDVMSFGSSLMEVATRLGGIAAPHVGEFVQPAFSIVSLVLIGLGLLRALIDFHATRTYALLIWLAIITPAVIISPQYLPILFVPSALFIAIGLQTLIREWYALFPRNPYARLFGLVPLLVLISGVITFNYTNYFYGLRYSPDAAKVYSSDLRLLNRVLARDDINKESIIIATNPEDMSFYSLLSKQNQTIKVVDVDTHVPPDIKGTYIATALGPIPPNASFPTNLSVNDRQHNALRWRTYVKW